MLRDTAAYYSRKASSWIVEDSYPDYMLKAEECLKKEKDRVSHYLHVSSETKLLEKVINELLVVYANELRGKEYSGSRALLRNDQVEDLSQMYRLFCRIPNELEPVANMFEQVFFVFYDQRIGYLVLLLWLNIYRLYIFRSMPLLKTWTWCNRLKIQLNVRTRSAK